jgi:hypothetical protein
MEIMEKIPNWAKKLVKWMMVGVLAIIILVVLFFSTRSLWFGEGDVEHVTDSPPINTAIETQSERDVRMVNMGAKATAAKLIPLFTKRSAEEEPNLDNGVRIRTVAVDNETGDTLIYYRDSSGYTLTWRKGPSKQ